VNKHWRIFNAMTIGWGLVQQLPSGGGSRLDGSMNFALAFLFAALPSAMLWSQEPAPATAIAVPLEAREPGAQESELPSPPPSGDRSAEAELHRVRLDFFETKIRPVLVEHCYECHSSQSTIVQANLKVDSRQGLEAGGDSGPAVAVGNPDASLIVQSLRYDSLQMPPSGKLDEAVVRDFEQWVREGAVDPRQGEGAATSKPWLDPSEIDSHWAFRPPENVAIPALSASQIGDAFASHPIDRFVSDGLRERGWEPSAPAEPLALMRRVTVSLTGVPPTPEEIQTYMADAPSERYARWVDRLLASPQYGVRWGRHWLDCVRYADTNGADENHEMPNAWRYRDWVVDAFNQDLPFDQFVIQQIAGDLLPAPDEELARGRLLTATGFWVLGPKMLAEQDKAKMRIDIVDEQVDTFSRTMLGVTLSCARCHDHKFDPFTQQDYYAVAGLLMSTRAMADEAFVSKWMERPLPSQARDRDRQVHQQKVDEAKARQRMLREQANRQLLAEGKLETLPEDPATANPGGVAYAAEAQKPIEDLAKEIEALEKSMPGYDLVMAVEENAPIDLPIHIRGNHLKPGDQTIPRGVPQILVRSVSMEPIESQQSGRLQLARWLTHPDHPLLARVMVNRIWMWHMGQPLVGSPSNFGLRGESPSHPQLLDWLAREWVRNGWSMKWLHRQILMSATYQMRSRSEAHREEDPENRWLWRQNTKRMEFEALRDSILSVTGQLDTRLGGAGQPPASAKRSIYLHINRAALADMFSVFDYVDPASHIEQRPVTTVPSQALFLMNSDLVTTSADRLAESLQRASNDPMACIDAAYARILSRSPTDWERERMHSFLQQAHETLVSESPAESQPPIEDPAQDPIRRQALSAMVRALLACREFSWLE
jgi:hypothetical protein